MKKAIYAFSGDPITYGHIDLIERASHIFDEVVVGIGVNPDKKYLFTLDERLEMAQKSLSNIKNTNIVAFQGLLVDYAYENDIQALIRGARDEKDMVYETQLYQIGGSQKLGIDTFILPAKQEMAHISSSAVKALQKEQGIIHGYVPLYVKQCLESAMSGQYIVGVTGEIGAGKTYMGTKLEEVGKKKGIETHNIELDYIGHKILGELTEPLYGKVRKQIVEEFGKDVELPNGFISRKELGDVVFKDPSKLDTLNELMFKPIRVRMRKEIYGKKGLILINAALIAESKLSFVCNNNSIIVNVDKTSQERRLKKRNMTANQITRRLATQYSAAEKKSKLKQRITEHNNGHIWCIDNSDGSNPKNIERLYDKVVKELKVK